MVTTQRTLPIPYHCTLMTSYYIKHKHKLLPQQFFLFGAFAGYRINWRKSQLLPIKFENSTIKVTSEKITYLETVITKNYSSLLKEHFLPLIEKLISFSGSGILPLLKWKKWDYSSLDRCMTLVSVTPTLRLFIALVDFAFVLMCFLFVHRIAGPVPVKRIYSWVSGEWEQSAVCGRRGLRVIFPVSFPWTPQSPDPCSIVYSTFHCCTHHLEIVK